MAWEAMEAHGVEVGEAAGGLGRGFQGSARGQPGEAGRGQHSRAGPARSAVTRCYFKVVASSYLIMNEIASEDAADGGCGYAVWAVSKIARPKLR